LSEASKNLYNSFFKIKDGVSSAVTMDSFRRAVVDGNAYRVSFADTTGIAAGASYYYWVKNTSATKSVWLRPIVFSQGTLLVRIIKDGTFALGGTTYNPENYHDITITGTITSGSASVTGVSPTTYLVAGMTIQGEGIPDRTYVAVAGSTITMSKVATASGTITMTCSLPSLVSRNLNPNYADNPVLKVWYQNTLGAITYTSAAVDQYYEVIESQMQEPDLDEDLLDVIPPGAYFMAVLTNYGTAKIPYRISVKWSEI
jgi:hypothetical protein